jgi:ATP-dependent Clp protease ATP-binding subunit ClpB
MIKEEVDAYEVTDVVASWTGIPVQKMLTAEKDRLLDLESLLASRVVGQDRAVQVVADAVRRSRSGLNDENKPVGSFLFLGTTGVGKTELAKALAESLFNDEKAIVRLDMSEFQERHSVSRLIGSPPGYVGYEEGGQLTEAVRRRPYSIVLLDELEKAHDDVFNLLLQVLDEGRLTDSKGRTVNFRNCIIIMTSNAGATAIQDHFLEVSGEPDGATLAAMKGDAMNELKKRLRPEFLNRIDEIVMFEPLQKKQLQSIVKIQLKQLEERLHQAGIQLMISKDALGWLADQGFSPEYGARPLKRLIQNQLLNVLSKALLSHQISTDTPMVIDVFENKMVLRERIAQEECFELS